MKVYVSIKQVGKKRPVLERREYRFPDGVQTLRKVLEYFTRTEAEKYNRRDEESYLLYSDEAQLRSLAEAGKIGFDYRHNAAAADPDEAVERTMLSFADGLVRVFLNDEELTELDAPVTIRENDCFTFIRLTFLTGRMW